MSIKSTVQNVTTTAAALGAAEADLGVGSRIAVVPASGTIYVGGPDVTTANGWPVTPTTPYADVLEAGERLYGVAGSTIATNVIQGGV